MDLCAVCSEKLWRGFCMKGHSQVSEPDTIDEALEQRSRNLGAIFSKAREEGLLPPIDQTSWSVSNS